jgi:hypothetical protein
MISLQVGLPKRQVTYMKLGDFVRFYEGQWFSEGRVTTIENDSAIVDFMDWKQRYKLTELRETYIHFARVFVAIGPGVVVEDFRN